MSKQHLHICLDDDGQTLHISIFRVETIGGVEVGPFVALDFDVLSSPAPDPNAWMKDSLVQVIERL